MWTLQELCLRPDMWLCSADWQFASLNGTDPILMIGMLTIWRYYIHDRITGDEDKAQRAKLFQGTAKKPILSQLTLPLLRFYLWFIATALDMLTIPHKAQRIPRSPVKYNITHILTGSLRRAIGTFGYSRGDPRRRRIGLMKGCS